MAAVGEETMQETNEAFVEDVAARITAAEERGLSARVDKANEDRDRFNEWVSVFYGYKGKHKDYINKCLSPLNCNHINTHYISEAGRCSILTCENPAEYIKTWNRKQEITDIINEALLIKGKSNG
jgi:hypothetical protein